MIRTNFLSYSIEDKMDPASLQFGGEYTIIDNVTAKLVHMGLDEDYRNDLAEDIKFSKDKKSMTIKLKKAFFSDGSQITADDLSKSIKRGVLRGTPHIDSKNMWVGANKLKDINEDIEGIKVISDRELELKLTRPPKEIFFFLTLIDLAVLHKSQYEKEKILVSDWMGVTSGAYKVDFYVDETTGKKILKLVANKKTHNYKTSMPQEVTFESYKGDDVMKRLKDLSLDIGVINFQDYLNNLKMVENTKGLDIFSNNTDGIIYLGLNHKSKIFGKVKNRQWVQKKILENYLIEEEYKNAQKKATQFFLPNAKGFIPVESILKQLEGVDTSVVPNDLKNGFTIRAITGMKYWVPPKFEEKLSKTLGLKVNLTLKESWKDLQKFQKERTYEATVMGYGMSYKVLGEALNLQYLGDSPPLADPTGEVKKLMALYQSKDNKDEEYKIIENIMHQMVNDSECVPLYYYSSPYFVKSSTLEAQNLHLDESIKFYKMAVK